MPCDPFPRPDHPPGVQGPPLYATDCPLICCSNSTHSIPYYPHNHPVSAILTTPTSPLLAFRALRSCSNLRRIAQSSSARATGPVSQPHSQIGTATTTSSHRPRRAIARNRILARTNRSNAPSRSLPRPLHFSAQQQRLRFEQWPRHWSTAAPTCCAGDGGGLRRIGVRRMRVRYAPVLVRVRRRSSGRGGLCAESWRWSLRCYDCRYGSLL